MYAEPLPRACRRCARHCRRVLADAFERTGLRRTDDVIRFVTWRLDGGQRAHADQLLLAARRAVEAGDAAAAEVYAGAAVAERGGFAAALALADALGRQGRVAAAVAVLDSAIAPTSRTRAELASLRATMLFWGLGELDAA